MDLSEALNVLRHHEAERRRRGVRRAAVFGSVARGEARSDSDVDILVDLDASIPIDVFAFVSLGQIIEDLFQAPVDVVNRAGLKVSLDESVGRDAVHAF
jgi:hypothetical protein